MKMKTIQFSVVFLMMFAANSIFAQHRSVEVICGQGTAGFSGDGGLAVDAYMGNVWGVVEDSQGNILFCDTPNGRVRRIDANTGIISTIAGNMPFGSYNGDDILAVDASLALPAGIALDGDENIYVSDLSQHRIRRIDAITGIITTYAGTGTSGYVSNGGKADTSAISAPTQMVFDPSGNLLFVDVGNYMIRQVTPTGYIELVAGIPDVPGGNVNGASIFSGLTPKGGIAMDDIGNVYFSTDNNKIMRANFDTGILDHIAGTGSAGYNNDNIAATTASLNAPVGLAFVNNSILIADQGNFRIRRVDLITGLISTVVGTGNPTYNGDYLKASATNIDPFVMFPTANGDLLISDNGNQMVRRVFDCFNPDIPVIGVSNINPCFGEEVTMWIESGSLNSAEYWRWSTTCFAGDSISNKDTLTIQAQNSDIFFVKGMGECTDEGFCGQITITSNCSDYHNAFSPNNDGYNDFWYVPFLDQYPDNEVRIFNRWGDEIIFIQNYSNIDRYWDGTGEDEVPVDPGTYYFTIKSGNELFNGWVQVVK